MYPRSPLSIIPAQLVQSPDGYLHGPALDTVTATGTAIGATLASIAAVAGDSLVVKNAPLQSKVRLLQLWTDNQVAGEVRIRSPKLHDNVDAIRSRAVIGDLTPLLPWGVPQYLFPQDTLIAELSGSAVGGDIESVVMLLHYEDLPGQQARLLDNAALQSRMVNLVGQRLAITLGSTAGYNGGRAINADTDLLKANTDYAVLGFTTNTEAAAICLRGPDTGNLRVSAPGEPGLTHHTNYWFPRLSRSYGMPLIPVINSANKGATLVDAVNDENGGTANVVIWLAELK